MEKYQLFGDEKKRIKTDKRMKASNIIYEKKFSEFIEEEQPDMDEKDLPTWLQLLLSVGTIIGLVIWRPFVFAPIVAIALLIMLVGFLSQRKALHRYKIVRIILRIAKRVDGFLERIVDYFICRRFHDRCFRDVDMK